MAMAPLAAGTVLARAGTLSQGLIALALISACVDTSGAGQQVTTVAIGGATNSSEYSLRVTETTAGGNFIAIYSMTTDGSATQTEIRDGLIAEMVDDPALGRMITKVVAGSNSIVLTGAGTRTFAVTFPSNPSTHLTASTVAAGFTQFAFGDAVQVNPALMSASTPAGTGGGSLGITVTTNNNSQALAFKIEITDPEGQPTVYAFAATSGASASATTDAIDTALVALLPSFATVTKASPLTTVTMPPGYSIAVTSAVTQGTVVLTIAATAPAPLPEIGVVFDDGTTAALETATGAQFVTGPRPGATFSVFRKSSRQRIRVRTTAALTVGNRVYALTSRAFSDAPAAGATLLRGARVTAAISSTVAEIEV